MMIEITGNRACGKSVTAYEIMSNINLEPIIVDANKQINKNRINYITNLKKTGTITGNNLFKGIGVGNILLDEDFKFEANKIYLFEIDDYLKGSDEYNFMKKSILAAMEADANIIYTRLSSNSYLRVRVLV